MICSRSSSPIVSPTVVAMAPLWSQGGHLYFGETGHLHFGPTAKACRRGVVRRSLPLPDLRRGPPRRSPAAPFNAGLPKPRAPIGATTTPRGGTRLQQTAYYICPPAADPHGG